MRIKKCIREGCREKKPRKSLITISHHQSSSGIMRHQSSSVISHDKSKKIFHFHFLYLVALILRSEVVMQCQGASEKVYLSQGVITQRAPVGANKHSLDYCQSALCCAQQTSMWLIFSSILFYNMWLACIIFRMLMSNAPIFLHRTHSWKKSGITGSWIL